MDLYTEKNSSVPQLRLNFGSYRLDLVTTVGQHAKSCSTSPASVGRPLKEATQVLADILDRVQVKDTVRSKNCLVSVLQ